jgi:hypothetical protein
MLSTETRLRLQEIARKIETGKEVSLNEMIWCEKWCKANRSAASIIRTARRRAITGETHPDSLDSFIEKMDLGFENPTDHKFGPLTPDELADFFHSDDENMRRD